MKLRDPWMVAVWPGMGSVALSAGYYLLAKLGMHHLSEFVARELFEVDHVDIEDGLIRPGALPRSRLFAWKDARKRNDILLFIGEAQPPVGRYAFCRKLIGQARELGVERVFTFAAMATHMHPEHKSRVFGAATDVAGLADLRQSDLELLKEGQISGLNGVLLGAAAEAGLHGACLLGEMPHIFAQVPFPKASLAVLEVFAAMAGIELDMSELREQARAVDARLGQILAQFENAMDQRGQVPGEGVSLPKTAEDDAGLGPEDELRIEELFDQAREDRAKAYELKRELDRLNVFAEYEDRFLDLFREPT
jgi:proteasome assembly chaperone (PAC2) family protein